MAREFEHTDAPIPMAGRRVVSVSTGIAGAYACKVLADAGADVIKLEPPTGDGLRRWMVGQDCPNIDDGALFQFLCSSTRSVAVDTDREPDLRLATALLEGADIVIWTPSDLSRSPIFDIEHVRAAAADAVVVAITPFGIEGPWSGRPASELTLQAWSGAAARGLPNEPPRSIGGNIGEWLSGMFAAAGALLALPVDETDSSAGAFIDVSTLECLAYCQHNNEVTYFNMAGRPWHPSRYMNVPDIEETSDGYVGFVIVTAQMWQDFCCMVEHPEWLDDEDLYTHAGRWARKEELNAAIRAWTSARTTSEVVELASAFRIPVAPIGNGTTLPEMAHFREGGYFRVDPRGGFLEPDLPYRFAGKKRPPVRPAPRIGEHTAQLSQETPVDDGAQAPRLVMDQPAAAKQAPRLPLSGLRVADFTAFWAGPVASQILSFFGAEVIHIESMSRPDAFRGITTKSAADDLWWEWGPLFHATNTNKLGLTLDMSTQAGSEFARQLIKTCDIVIENFSPRVMDSWGLSFEELRALNPDIIAVRMPAFGLEGPWRNWSGFAQTMEQISGLAYVTGFEDGPPTTVNGPCDPIAGVHATIATLLALLHRRVTGEGLSIESVMVASALNIAAEQVISQSAYGIEMKRTGNRGLGSGLEDLFGCRDVEPSGSQRWVAVSAHSDSEIAALRKVLENDEAYRTADDTDLEKLHEALTQWCSARSSNEVVERLWEVDIPVGAALMPHEVGDLAHLQQRNFYETVDHPVTGQDVLASFPGRPGIAGQRMHRSAAPTLGQHNEFVLCELLGAEPSTYTALVSDGVIGTTIAGALRRR